MVCPKCKNKNFMPSKEVKTPLHNRGKQKYSAVNYRYYVCLECGYNFITKEEFEREIVTKKNGN